MSNFLAIATVTATLSQVLQVAVGVDVPGAAMTTVRPDSTGSGLPTTGVNLYLYQVTPVAPSATRICPPVVLMGT